MGVEVKPKAVLRLMAGEDKNELLDLLLENPRDWSLSAHGLFAKALPTLAGRALGDDHRELAKQVQKLFVARNSVAHRGEFITREDAVQHVKTAQTVIRFCAGFTGREAVRARRSAPNCVNRPATRSCTWSSSATTRSTTTSP